eukprot:14729809-Alexandrium_andersonii.AAC.1
MSASLVGSEMCIRDSPTPETRRSQGRSGQGHWSSRGRAPSRHRFGSPRPCLLYTSDAADDM